jgi:hypothetical protein
MRWSVKKPSSDGAEIVSRGELFNRTGIKITSKLFDKKWKAESAF